MPKARWGTQNRAGMAQRAGQLQHGLFLGDSSTHKSRGKGLKAEASTFLITHSLPSAELTSESEIRRHSRLPENCFYTSSTPVARSRQHTFGVRWLLNELKQQVHQEEPTSPPPRQMPQERCQLWAKQQHQHRGHKADPNPLRGQKHPSPSFWVTWFRLVPGSRTQRREAAFPSLPSGAIIVGTEQ